VRAKLRIKFAGNATELAKTHRHVSRQFISWSDGFPGRIRRCLLKLEQCHVPGLRAELHLTTSAIFIQQIRCHARKDAVSNSTLLGQALKRHSSGHLVAAMRRSVFFTHGHIARILNNPQGLVTDG